MEKQGVVFTAHWGEKMPTATVAVGVTLAQ